MELPNYIYYAYTTISIFAIEKWLSKVLGEKEGSTRLFIQVTALLMDFGPITSVLSWKPLKDHFLLWLLCEEEADNI